MKPKTTKRHLRKRKTNKLLGGALRDAVTSTIDSENIKRMIDAIYNDIFDIHLNVKQKNEKTSVDPNANNNSDIKKVIQGIFDEIDKVQKRSNKILERFSPKTAINDAKDMAKEGGNAHAIAISMIDPSNSKDLFKGFAESIIVNVNRLISDIGGSKPPASDPAASKNATPSTSLANNNPFEITDKDRNSTKKNMFGKSKTIIKPSGKIKDATQKLVTSLTLFKDIQDNPEKFGLKKPDTDPMYEALKKASNELFKPAHSVGETLLDE